MTKFKLLMLLLYQLCIPNVVSANQLIDVNVTFLEDGVLPCYFRPAKNELIHWQRKPNGKDILVHSYYDGHDQLENQDKQYVSRTKLFHDAITTGNASLLLSRIQVLDNGRYTCYVSTDAGKTEGEVLLRVVAPLTYLVFNYEINNGTGTLRCSAAGYPKPNLKWTDGTEDNYNSESSTTNNDGLPSVTQILPITDLNNTYTCTGRQAQLNQMLKVTWKMQGKIHGQENNNVTIPCKFSKADFSQSDFVVTWTLKKQDGISSVISYKTKLRVNERFKERAFINETEIYHGEATLLVMKLRSTDTGEYMCNISSKDNSLLIVTKLLIASSEKLVSTQTRIRKYILIPFLAVLASVFLFFVIRCIRKSTDQSENNTTPEQDKVLGVLLANNQEG